MYKNINIQSIFYNYQYILLVTLYLYHFTAVIHPLIVNLKSLLALAAFEWFFKLDGLKCI